MRVSLWRRLPASLEAGALTALCDALVAAETEGLDAVWLASPPGAPAAAALAVAAAAVAQRTERIDVGLWLTVGGEGHPLHWAEALLQLDVVSQGRARLAARLPEGEPGVRARAREQLLVLRDAVRGAPVTHRGESVEVVDVQCHPGPFREAGPPLALAGGDAAGALARELGLPFLSESASAPPFDGPTPEGVVVGADAAREPAGWLALAEAGITECVLAGPEADRRAALRAARAAIG